MADGPFRDPKGRSYPHPKYWTHRRRININIGQGNTFVWYVMCLDSLNWAQRVRFHCRYWYQSFIDGSNIWDVDRTDPWGSEMDHPPLGPSYVVVVPSYENVLVMAWPSMSPDLSPIEDVWDEMDRWLRQRPNQPVTQEVWQEIPQAFHANLEASMRRRCQECANARGGHPLLTVWTVVWPPLCCDVIENDIINVESLPISWAQP